jgi:predicted RNA-binding Zn ribbon-like protein
MRTSAVDLPEHLSTPLASGADWWYWLGGRPALDFVNTLRERWNRRVETLVTGDDLAKWLVRAELLEEPARVGRALLHDARELRESIDLGVEAVIAGGRPPRAALAVVDGWLERTGTGRLRLLPGPEGRPVLAERLTADPVQRALGAIALDAARMLGTAESARVRVCASDTCSARFYDRSPAGRRRWCSMAACGNEAKARRHRARRRERPGATPRHLEAS